MQNKKIIKMLNKAIERKFKNNIPRPKSYIGAKYDRTPLPFFFHIDRKLHYLIKELDACYPVARQGVRTCLHISDEVLDFCFKYIEKKRFSDNYKFF